jgi:methylamine--corrinoid protein Co-methyltransferase
MGVLWELLDRAETGEYMPEVNFNLRLSREIKRLVKEYEIKFDRDRPVPADRSLANDVFQAALDLLRTTGVYCENTNRTIKFTEEEIQQATRNSRRSVTFGENNETHTVSTRRVEDQNPPMIMGGGAGTMINEGQNYVKNMASYAKEPLNQVIMANTPATIEGRPIRARSPLEVHATRCEVAWIREAARTIGRPNMPIVGTASGLSAQAQISAASVDGLKRTDGHLISMATDLKTNYETLSKVCHSIEYGGNVVSLYTSMYGGYAGGAEGLAIVCTAAPIAETILHYATTHLIKAMHLNYVNTSCREALWATSVVAQAHSQNTGMLLSNDAFTSAGPCTEMVLYEIATNTIASTASGMAFLEGVGTATTANVDHATGLEVRCMAKLGQATSRESIKLNDANDLVKKIIVKYEDKFQNPPLGKTFQECYDLRNIEPTPEWMSIYRGVTKELVDLGIPVS